MPWETEIRVGVDVLHRLCLWEMDKTLHVLILLD